MLAKLVSEGVTFEGQGVDSEHMSAVHALLTLLEAEGVEYIFGVPGGPLTALFEAMQERGTIRLVLAKHEGGAAFMAASHARVRGGLAVCCGTSGPGATNALTGIASAQADSLPVLFLTGQVSTNVFGKGAIQESSVFGIDLVSLFRPVTKLSAMFPNAERVPDLVRSAIRIAKGGRPGVVHLNMPADMLRRSVPVGAVRPALPFVSQVIDLGALASAAALLALARRPCLLAGHGVELAGAADDLVRFAHAAQVPVMTSPKGKGVFPETDALSLGVLGFGGHERAERYLQSGAIDLLLVVGSSLNEFVTNAWTLPVAGATSSSRSTSTRPSSRATTPWTSRSPLTRAWRFASWRRARTRCPRATANHWRAWCATTPRHFSPAAMTSDAHPL